jgi:cyclin-dependent kinase
MPPRYSILGTPSEAVWPSLPTLPDYKPNFPIWAGDGLAKTCPTLDEHGLDLMSRMLTYDPGRRISAKQALNHPYFRDVDGGGAKSG